MIDLSVFSEAELDELNKDLLRAKLSGASSLTYSSGTTSRSMTFRTGAEIDSALAILNPPAAGTSRNRKIRTSKGIR